MFAGQSPAGIEPSVQSLRIAQVCVGRNTRLLAGRFELVVQRGVMKWLESTQPDALVTTPNPRFPQLFAVQRWMRRAGRPCIGWGLGTMPVAAGLPMFVRTAVRRPVIAGFDAFIAYSSRAAAEYVSMGVPGNRVRIARNATAVRPTQPPPERTVAHNRPVRLVALGQLTAPKRIDLLISACSRLNATRAGSVCLWVIGEGDARKSLERQAERELPEVRFLGHLSGDNLRRVLWEADLFVMPGLGGLAIQEAMASGLPVIVAEGDGTQADLVRPENGWNIPPDDLQALMDCIGIAVRRPERLLSMGRESFRIVDQEINLETMVDAYVSAVRDFSDNCHRGAV